VRPLRRSARWLAAGIAVAALAGCGYRADAAPSARPHRSQPATSTSTSTTTTTTAPAAQVLAAVAYATGNAQLDALLPTLPPLLSEGGAAVHFGYNPLDTCCHAGGYNPVPNDVWIGQAAFTSPARLTYVAVHELAHSVHIKTARATALTAAVAGAPVVRAGSAWDDSEKVADCVAWVLYPAETAAAGITYWGCPEPWRSQVRAALQ
jgi:hypothetical protein